MATFRQIRTAQQIQSHLLLLYTLQPSMTVGGSENGVSAVSRFIYDLKRPEEIVLKTGFPEMPQGTELHVSYVLEGYEHRFASRIMTFNPIDGAGAFLKIHVPSAIYAQNRRNYSRVCPGRRDPVQATIISQEGQGGATYTVQDISAGGLSFLGPPRHQLPLLKKEMNVRLHLPDRSTFSAWASLRNMLERDDCTRIGLEFIEISKEHQKRLVNYILERKFKFHRSRQKDSSSRLPVLCVINDNCAIDGPLSYLENAYRLIRQDIQGDWKPMAKLTADILLFNLISVRFDKLLPKLRTLNNFQKTPAIVISDEKEIECPCDTTFLSEFKDPAVLIDAIEQTIAAKTDGPKEAAALFQTDFDSANDPKLILVIDVKNTFPGKIIDFIISKKIEIKIVNHLQGILDFIRKIKPDLIVIHADFDSNLTNFLRMLKLNKFANSVPLSLLIAEEIRDRIDFNQTLYNNINIFPNDMDPLQLAARLVALVTCQSKT